MAATAALNIEITAATEKLRSELQRGERATRDFERSITSRLDKIGGLMRGGLYTGVAIAALQRFGAAAVHAAEELGQIGEKAENLGITSQFYQTLTGSALEGGIAVEKFDAAMGKFAKSVAQARQGSGPLVEALEKMNPTLLENIRHAGSNEDAFRALSDAIARTESPTQRALIAFAAFGKGGLPMLQVLKGGSDGLDEMARKAQDTGYALDAHVIKRADELGDRFLFASKAAGNQFSAALTNMMPLLIKSANLLGYLATKANDLAESFNSISDASGKELQKRLDVTSSEIDRRAKRLSEFQAMESGFSKWWAEGTAEEDKRQLAKLREEAAQIEETLKGRDVSQTYEKTRTRIQESDIRDIEALKTKKEAALKELDSLHKKMLDQTDQRRAALDAEYDIELTKFKKLLTDKLISQQQFDAAVIDLEKIRSDKMRELDVNFKLATQAANAFGQEIETALSNAFDTGEFNAKKMFTALYKQIALTAVRLYALQPLFGGGDVKNGGMMGGLLTTLVGSASANGNVFAGGALVPFANGGVVQRPALFGMKGGRLGLMGEAGPEAILPLSRGTDGKLGVAASGNAAPVVNFHVTATDVGSFQRSEGQMTAMLSRMVSRANRYS